MDTGGTFTDFVLYEDETGELLTWKTSSTPFDPSEAILTGALELLGRRNLNSQDVGYLGHGTTVATNAFLQGEGAVTGLITTSGFEDMLEIGRQARPHLYDLHADKLPSVVPGRRRLGVRERVDYQGRVLVPLDEDDVRRAIRSLGAQGAQAIAICFLHSWVNPEHERRVVSLIGEESPSVYVAASSEVLPEIREYERLSTTVLSASLGPIIARYADRLAERLRRADFRVVPQITQSNGGIMSLHAAGRRAVETAFSGPAAGVSGAAYVARIAGFPNVISLDMGGTSADIAVVEEGQAKVTTAKTIGPYPARVPMIDVDSVGAGGGSIAYVDLAGGLRVGPQSAGAVPGPACYGRGGTEPTVTDAHAVLGHFGKHGLLRGGIVLDLDSAYKAVTRLADRIALDPQQLAQGILRIADANMLRLIRKLSVTRGHDPRDYVLVAFGGCGPLHAADLAEELGIRQVLVPEGAGVLSALGQLVADIRADFVHTAMRTVQPLEMASLENLFTDLESRGAGWLEEEGVAPDQRSLARFADARYVGQNWELTIDMPPARFGSEAAAVIAHAFHAAHRRRYSYDLPDRRVEVVNCRVTALGLTSKPTLPKFPPAADGPEVARRETRSVVWPTGPVETPVYGMDQLAPGHRIRGPAIIEQFTSTVVVRPGDVARIDPYRNVILQIKQR